MFFFFLISFPQMLQTYHVLSVSSNLNKNLIVFIGFFRWSTPENPTIPPNVSSTFSFYTSQFLKLFHFLSFLFIDKTILIFVPPFVVWIWLFYLCFNLLQPARPGVQTLGFISRYYNLLLPHLQFWLVSTNIKCLFMRET